MPLNILKIGIDGAKILIGNDYEISMILKKLSWTKKKLIDKVNILIITKGTSGSEIYNNKKIIKIFSAKTKKILIQ